MGCIYIYIYLSLSLYRDFSREAKKFYRSILSFIESVEETIERKRKERKIAIFERSIIHQKKKKRKKCKRKRERKLSRKNLNRQRINDKNSRL